jgi:shikimate kinase
LNKVKKASAKAAGAEGAASKSAAAPAGAGKRISGSAKPVLGARSSGSIAAPPGRVVFLIGFTGSGKSTVGRLLAIRMGNPFVDLEQEISQHAGMATPMIVSRYGEEGYRGLETAVLEKVLDSGEGPSMIIATGEGVVDTPRNVEMMRRRGLVCFLQASFDEALRRLSSEVPVRPAVQDSDGLLRNYEMRAKLYGSAAHMTLSTDQRDPSQIVLELSQKLDEHDKSRSRGRGSKRSRSS